MKLKNILLVPAVLLPVGILIAAGSMTSIDTYSLLAEQQGNLNLRAPGDVNNDGVLDKLDEAAVDDLAKAGTYDPHADLDFSKKVDDADRALIRLMRAGRASVTLLVADSNFDGRVDGEDAIRFLRLYQAGSELANFTRHQNPPNANDRIDAADLKAWRDAFVQQTQVR